MAVSALVERLAHLITKEVNLHLQSKKFVENLIEKLEKIQETLNIAERTEVTDLQVKNWLKELQDVSYEMDDALDEWQIAELQLQIEGFEEVSNILGKVISFIPSICLCFKNVHWRREINLKIEDLFGKLDRIVQGKDDYRFPSGGNNLQKLDHQIESTSFDTATVYGRSIEKETLIRNLLSEGSGVKIVSIVGMVGVGKSALAQFAFKDSEVEKRFKLKAWICVSKHFDEKKIATQVLQAFEGSSSDFSSLEMLLQQVKTSVSKKKFLIVLDDVWNVNHNKWEPLKNSLQGASGGRILVTTRSGLVVKAIHTDTKLQLGQLSDEECWSLLSSKAFVGRSKEECKKLKDVGREIALNCKGLPLAAKSMGRLLHLKDTIEEWLNVVKIPLWHLEEETAVELFSPLYLIYNDLSPVPKCCFSSCVIYPKDTLIYLDELIRIWMAHGYLGSSGNVDLMQTMGLKFFKNLEMVTFFQGVENDKYEESKFSCKMHNIMHDFVTYLSKDKYCLIFDGGVKITNCDIIEVRTFCARKVSQEGLLLNVFSRLKCVRVMIASDCGLEELPQEIGKLIHLRYLDLSFNPIIDLPETLCDLYHLQTLDLRKCLRLSALPQGIYKLRYLRHLLFEVQSMNSIPRGLARLTGLWMLSSFIAGRGSNQLGYLEKLNQLRGSLELHLGDLSDLDDAEKAKLQDKKYIQKLSFFFTGEVTVDIMKALQPPPNLHYLRVSGYGGTQLPVWITKSLDHLKVLKIESFEKCSYLPSLGKLPMLEELEISLMDSMKSVGNEFLGIQEQPNMGPAFPNLRKLYFSRCGKWEEWEDITEDEKNHLSIMPRLRELEIDHCDMLKALPHRLLRMPSSLKYLTVRFSSFLSSLYGDSTGNARNEISHNCHIKVDS